MITRLKFDADCQPAVTARLTRELVSFSLPSPSSSQTELALSSGGGTKREAASLAGDGRLSVRENGCNGEALGALDVHKVGVGGLD